MRACEGREGRSIGKSHLVRLFDYFLLVQKRGVGLVAFVYGSFVNCVIARSYIWYSTAKKFLARVSALASFPNKAVTKNLDAEAIIQTSVEKREMVNIE